MAIPVAAASGIWYGTLVWLGATAGKNLDALIRWVQDTNKLLLVIALVLAVVPVWWWVRTRRHAGR